MCPQRDSGFPGTPTLGSWKHREAVHRTPLLFLCGPSSSVPLAGPCSSFSPSQLSVSLWPQCTTMFLQSECVASSLSHTFLNLEVNDPVVRWTSLCLVFVCLVLAHGTLDRKKKNSCPQIQGCACQAFLYEIGGSSEHISGGPLLIYQHGGSDNHLDK